MLSVGKVVVFFSKFVAIFGKNMALLVKQFFGEKKLSKSIFGYFKTKKGKSSDITTKLEGGRGVRLSGRTTNRRTFLRLPLEISITPWTSQRFFSLLQIFKKKICIPTKFY